MKIKFTKDKLNKALHILQKASQTKINSNIPGCVYLTTKGNKVEMQANDYDLAMQVVVDAEIYEPGTVVVASKYFQDMVRRMPNDEIIISQTTNNSTVTIVSGSAQYDLVTYDVEEFTLVEEIFKEFSIKIDTLDLKNLIDLTAYAVSTDETRPIFTGVLMEVKGNEVSMVGTDTHRLAVKKVKIDEASKYDMNSVIPAKILVELAKLLPVNEPQLIEVIWNKTQVAFVFDNVYMVARFVEGKFPAYEKIIPQQFNVQATLNRRELIGAVERVSLVSQGNSYNAIKFEWDVDNVTLSSQNIDIGSAKENIPCELKGNPFSISFNGRYIIDILKHGTGDFVCFNLTERGPMVIRLNENPNYTYVATPIRTN